MKKKLAILAITTLVLATSASAMAATATEQPSATITDSTTALSSPVGSSTTSSLTEDGLVTPQVVTGTFHYIAAGSSTVANSFVVPAGYGHIKLFMKNNGTGPVTVSLTHNSSGLIYFNKTIAAGSSLEWISYNEGITQGMRAGDYTLQWRGGSYTVNGEVWGGSGSSSTDW
ncbi:hypothetical protein KIH86_04035 [Paenibacillus sp. HN-1]|uniref:hypothetical protein n=1 Tax=Paenibacillus TaxID=44249 RepID=UPI001CA979F1|nr:MULTISPECIES: hypothetical protein [Paenibacillus]MBY9077098.1 hypothetical protein [Paenibacillus sp. CGMCC 1.18879]MBY9083396.1 hypothetical protein [Paenibacillus sinensis]